MKSDTGNYSGLPRAKAARKRYRAVVKLHNGHTIIARSTYGGMLEAETAASNWVKLLNHFFPNTRLQKIHRIKNGTR